MGQDLRLRFDQHHCIGIQVFSMYRNVSPKSCPSTTYFTSKSELEINSFKDRKQPPLFNHRKSPQTLVAACNLICLVSDSTFYVYKKECQRPKSLFKEQVNTDISSADFSYTLIPVSWSWVTSASLEHSVLEQNRETNQLI